MWDLGLDPGIEKKMNGKKQQSPNKVCSVPKIISLFDTYTVVMLALGEAGWRDIWGLL